jgi:hypothetical protein
MALTYVLQRINCCHAGGYPKGHKSRHPESVYRPVLFQPWIPALVPIWVFMPRWVFAGMTT